jgi:hypothetical protein
VFIVVDKKTWKEFRECGLLWWINMILHTFGWAIVLSIATEDEEGYTKGEIIEVYPARVRFRGFDNDNNTKGYIEVSKYLKENAEQLEKESLE